MSGQYLSTGTTRSGEGQDLLVGARAGDGEDRRLRGKPVELWAHHDATVHIVVDPWRRHGGSVSIVEEPSRHHSGFVSMVVGLWHREEDPPIAAGGATWRERERVPAE